jgi:hypothetical protein
MISSCSPCECSHSIHDFTSTNTVFTSHNHSYTGRLCESLPQIVLSFRRKRHVRVEPDGFSNIRTRGMIAYRTGEDHRRRWKHCPFLRTHSRHLCEKFTLTDWSSSCQKTKLPSDIFLWFLHFCGRLTCFTLPVLIPKHRPSFQLRSIVLQNLVFRTCNHQSLLFWEFTSPL